MKEKLKKLLEKAYAPYSNFKVAAIVEMKDGTFFEGVNIENALYSSSICAERVAIHKAISKGYKKGDFLTLYLMSEASKITYPCFVCRQTMAEFFTGDEEVVLFNKDDNSTLLARELLVYPFNKSDLN